MGSLVALKPDFGSNKPDNGGKQLEACPFCAATPHLEQDGMLLVLINDALFCQ
ncbi:hypothetical protein IAH99_13935 [Vibrio cholerae]|uniref:hypothetical protein n=1 Tax=Vibrio cholerae TaxID=666 RepID=UPI001657C42C|nr:hypothetical protein [Vibrio cholerae]MBC9069445.1 hypothetical protein [Vibrio cholerae]